ncbi:AAI domain-containing protein [Heracleum sosnowskyi]|uniref:AAI domain-containing protein n=1 Tax=Heracleum sosnowskyi TaxID=360622 RepID=A0AAD8JAZ4_9APIA|nr:AAI domain-containing protein [Heracleum sosnowskyi]
MENANSVFRLNFVSATVLIFFVVSVNCQISTPCTVSMLTSFTPCLNFITGSTRSGASSPSTACCESLKSLMISSVDCSCLLVTGNVPFALPINQTLALTLPRACNSASVPIQCKAAGVPLPAPGPVLFGPKPPPTAAASPFSPTAAKALAPASAPAKTISGMEPGSPPAETTSENITPTATPGIRPVINPTSASTCRSSSQSLLLAFLGIMFFTK